MSRKQALSTTPFWEKVFTVVRRIPRGVTLTYQEVAHQAGNPRAARAVGSILKTNYNPKIPCHRVVRSDGTLGGYNRGAQEKIRRLKKEGVKTFSYSQEYENVFIK